MLNIGDTITCRDGKYLDETAIELVENGYQLEIEGRVITIIGKETGNERSNKQTGGD